MKTRKTALAIAFGVLLWGTPLFAFYEGWDAQYEIEQFERPNGQKFNLISVSPQDVKSQLEGVAEPERTELFWRLYWNRLRANVLLNVIVEFVLETIRPGMVEPESEPDLRQFFQKIRSGRYPFMLVTPARNNFHVHQVFGMGLDLGEGLPNEVRLQHAPGMKPLPRTLGASGPIPICYIPPTGRLECDQKISAVLSQIPRIHGDALEIRTLHKSRTSPYDFTEVLIARALSKHWLTWGGRLLPPEARLPPLQEPLLSQVLALQKTHPELPEELLFPEKQKRYAVSHLFGHTLTDSREHVFEEKFGAKRVMPLFPDIHFPKRFAHWVGVEVATLRDPKSPFQAALSVKQAMNRIAVNVRDPLWCAVLLSTSDYEMVTTLPNDYFSIWRMGVEADWILPTDSFLAQQQPFYLPK